MTIDRLLEILKERGLNPYLDADGKPKLKGDAANLSPELKEVLTRRRGELIALLAKPPAVDFVWTLNGMGAVEKHFHPHAQVFPVGRLWWRAKEDEPWKPIPGRAENLPAPKQCSCGRWLHSDGSCWKCCNRPCEVCRKPTGSAFIRTCDVCHLNTQRSANEQAEV